MSDKFKNSYHKYLPVVVLLFSPFTNAEPQKDTLDLSVEDLLNVKVTSVAKKAQSLNDAPAAAFVISQDDIKRSGATSIPDALRLAPGLDVARIDANKWAVSSRGFNGRFSNKLLVLIDGRSAYTRSFSGVYWENQDVMMEDVDRIEVIRGPGATLWGANAVNGVINIITKDSAKTQGALLNVGGGTEEQGFGSFRYGTQWGEHTSARAYIKGFNRDTNTHVNTNTNVLGITRTPNGNAGDNWDKVQGGFRLDSQLNSQDTLKLQGDIYQANINQSSVYQQVFFPFTFTQKDKVNSYGGNVLGRFQHTFSPTSDYALQFYYDTYTRDDPETFDARDTLDLDFQHRFNVFDWHEIVWGLNYRYGHDRLFGRTLQNGIPLFSMNPTSVNDQVYSGFLQDEMTLINDKLWLTIGSKFEHNDYSGFEGQPSARIMWAPYSQHRFWAGVSRAVHTPSRAEQGVKILTAVVPSVPPLGLPLAINTQGNPNLKSEEVITYELGYRTTFSKTVSLDMTGFYNDYQSLRYGAISSMPTFNGISLEVPMQFSNSLKGKTYGVEIATVWQMLDWWRWDINYSWLHTSIDARSPVQTPTSPQHRVSLRGALSPWDTIDMDFWLRYVSANHPVTEFGSPRIPSYMTLDLRVAWRPQKNVELSLVGQNLLAQNHLEYVQENQTLPTAIDRGMYGKISWGF